LFSNLYTNDRWSQACISCIIINTHGRVAKVSKNGEDCTHEMLLCTRCLDDGGPIDELYDELEIMKSTNHETRDENVS
jgi:hypothetical protein